MFLVQLIFKEYKMLGISLLVISFIVALIGFIQSNQAESGDVFLFGLTKVGSSLVIFSILGFIIGIRKEIQSSRDNAWRTDKLEELSREIRKISVQTKEQAASKIFSAIGNRIEAIATNAPESDFHDSLFNESNFHSSVFKRSNLGNSDFSEASFCSSVFNGSDFAHSDFSDANFSNSIFEGALFNGSDLSSIVIDENTKLPDHINQRVSSAD